MKEVSKYIIAGEPAILVFWRGENDFNLSQYRPGRNVFLSLLGNLSSCRKWRLLWIVIFSRLVLGGRLRAWRVRVLIWRTRKTLSAVSWNHYWENLWRYCWSRWNRFCRESVGVGTDHKRESGVEKRDPKLRLSWWILGKFHLNLIKLE